ncbi:unnamed protein product, partial [Candidula unifasciata]
DDDDDDDDVQSRETLEENSKMKEKMDQLRINMEKISLTKKKKHLKAPSPGPGPHSSVARMRLRGLTSAGRSPSATLAQTLNKNMCLPPVGHTFVGSQIAEVDASSGATSSYSVAVNTLAQTAAAGESEPSLLAVTTKAAALSITTADASVLDKSESAASQAEVVTVTSSEMSDDIGAEGGITTSNTTTTYVSATDVPPLIPHPPFGGTSLRRGLLRLSGLSETAHNFTAASARRHEALSVLETLQEARSLNHPHFLGGTDDENSKMPGKRKVSEKWNSSTAGHAVCGDPYKRSPISSRKDFVLDSFLRPATTARRKDFTLGGLNSSETCAMSGILRQASIEKIGSSHIGSIVNSASKSRLGGYGGVQESGRISTPENHLLSARLQRVPAVGERQRISPTHRLPPMKAKKKQKRCLICGKKTGLATSYQCRCGNNFCASHRYAESHDCTFDYKTEGRKLLEQNNPLVSAPKLPKI